MEDTTDGVVTSPEVMSDISEVCRRVVESCHKIQRFLETHRNMFDREKLNKDWENFT